jgi:hypothetical protein
MLERKNIVLDIFNILQNLLYSGLKIANASYIVVPQPCGEMRTLHVQCVDSSPWYQKDWEPLI